MPEKIKQTKFIKPTSTNKNGYYRFEYATGGDPIIILIPLRTKRFDLYKSIKFIKFIYQISSGLK